METETMCWCGDHESNEDTIAARIERIEQKVNELHLIVTTLVAGIGDAQKSGGMAGMMARQLPDVAMLAKG